MKTESTLSIVQTAATCVIALLLLVLTFSRSAPAASAMASVDPLQELSALCQVVQHLNREFDNNESEKRSLDSKNPDETERGFLERFTKRNEVLGSRIDAINKVIEEKFQALPQAK